MTKPLNVPSTNQLTLSLAHFVRSHVPGKRLLKTTLVSACIKPLDNERIFMKFDRKTISKFVETFHFQFNKKKVMDAFYDFCACLDTYVTKCLQEQKTFQTNCGDTFHIHYISAIPNGF
jgi:hypothetical protein